MKKIFFLKDYKGFFGSKYDDIPYRSGFDETLLKKYFSEHNLDPVYMGFCDVDFVRHGNEGEIYLYTSSEDSGYLYKSYIEDIVIGLENKNALILPAFKFLRANNNKVFMEILRHQFKAPYFKTLKSRYFGTYEEAVKYQDDFNYPIVIKTSGGASGKGVYLVKNKEEYEHRVKKISRSKNYRSELWDFGRSIKHKNYTIDSIYRAKFIVQEYIPGLKNDWKIYVFGDRYYIFYRPILKGRDIRASGGGYENYCYGEDANRPDGIFDFARSVYDTLNTPHVSMDIAFDGNIFHLLEFQCVYFGTAGIVKSKNYYMPHRGGWKVIEEKLPQEKVYADSIYHYLSNHQLL